MAAAEPTPRGRRWRGAALAAPLAVFSAIAIVLPLATLVRQVFTPAGLEALELVLGPGRQRTALVNSLWLSAAASSAAVVLALPAAWALGRGATPLRGLVRAAILLPTTFSGVLVGFLAVAMLGSAGLVPAVAELLFGEPLLAGQAYTVGGIFVAYLYFELPRATLTLEPAMRALPPALDEVARTLGAGRVQRMLWVHLPLLAPALRAAWMVTFAASMGSFGVALILAKRFTVAPLEIYTELTAFSNDTLAAVLCLFLATATALAGQLTAERR